MTRYLLLLLFTTISLLASAQLVLKHPPKKSYSDKQLQKEKANHDCLHRNKYTSLQRLGFYPFNKAAKIQIVAYIHGIDSVVLDTATGDVIKVPIQNDTLFYSKLKERISLASNQIDSLTDILYNTGYKGPVYGTEESECFTPRNAILFLDSTGKTFEYIEICFQCNRYECSSDNVTIGEICSQKYEILNNYFISLGIKIGTLDESDTFGYEPD